MSKRITNRVVTKYNKYQMMSTIYAMYMAVGSMFGSVNCIFDTERAFFRGIYKQISHNRGTDLESMCTDYVENVLKKEVVMDVGFEDVSCYISYDNDDNWGRITYTNNRIELAIEISMEGDDYDISYYEHIYERELHSFSMHLSRDLEIGA